MNLFLKILKLFALLILTVSLVLFSASFLLRDKVGIIILKSLNKNLSTKLDVGSYKLSFLRKFPKASLELRDVLVHSSPDFNSGAFKGINTDTLLAARFVSVEFKITDILKGIYDIESIGAKIGKANFFTDTTGHVNYDISVKTTSPGTNETIIDLKRINIADFEAYYNNLAAHLIISGVVKNGKLKSRISGNTIDFTAGTEMQIKRFELYTFKITKSVPAKLDLNLLSSKSGIHYRKSTLHLDNYDIGLDGFVSSDNIFDLNLSGRNIDISKIPKYLPDKYVKLISEYNLSGLIIASGKIKGQLSRTSNPHVEINWHLKNGRIAYAKSDLILKDLSLEGYFSNGSKNRFTTCLFSITGFKAKLGSSEYTGLFILKDFNNPAIDFSLKGRVFPGELKEFFDLKSISEAKGSVDIDLKLVNRSWSGVKISLNGIIDLKPEGRVTFNSLTIGWKDNNILFGKIDGDLEISKLIQAKNLKFAYKGQNIKINGKFQNLPEWISGRPVKMIATADVSFDRLIPGAFLSDSGKTTRPQRAFTMPGDLFLDLNFKIDSLSYKTFSSARISGNLNYKPRILSFKTLKMQALNGSISGNGLVAQNTDKSFLTKGSYDVTNIDVNKAFTTFHNFGQSFLKAENIKGTLSGSLSLIIPVDSTLKFHINTLTAEGKYHLVNGALINFDPVKQLSSFIELSELENINFEQLDNDFFIRKNFLYIPQMEVNSSAADLSVNGKHSFDNDYEYHVKILLSEILSKKRKKNKSNVTEFGVVEDDGLGRTSLLLKIIGKGDLAKVNYDMKAAGTEVKNNFNKERKTLKTILNEEYGWYKNDSAVKQKPEEKKTRFKIIWEDSDTVKTAPNP